MNTLMVTTLSPGLLSKLKIMTGPYIIPRKENPHVITKETLPLTMGHEFCGRISETPSNPKSRFKKGQAVMIDPRYYCSTCFRCTTGNDNACVNWGFLGLSGGGGGLSEFVAVPESFCHLLPDDADLSTAALIEPMAVAYHAVRKTGIEEFEWISALVLGGGPIGMAVSVVLRMRGVKKIFVSEPTVTRQGHCRELVEVVLDPTKEKVGDRCREMTNGLGVDVVFDCAGIASAMGDGMDAMKYGGIYLSMCPCSPFILRVEVFRSYGRAVRPIFLEEDISAPVSFSAPKIALKGMLTCQ
jgi:threonine dehydrogenase-like Zn-dependent dehydrogenase